MGTLSERFAYHPPKNEATRQAHERVREACHQAAQSIDDMVPHSREKSLAHTAMQEAMMWANAAIAIHGLEEQDETSSEALSRLRDDAGWGDTVGHDRAPEALGQLREEWGHANKLAIEPDDKLRIAAIQMLVDSNEDIKGEAVQFLLDYIRRQGEA